MRLSRDGDTVEERFKSGDGPRALTLVHPAGQGDGAGKGLNPLAHEGPVRRVIGGHWGLMPGLGRLALDNRIEADNLPKALSMATAAHNSGGIVIAQVERPSP